jgi:hypothetical protein
MSSSKDRGRARKKSLNTYSSTVVSILISFTLITGGFILITPTLIAAAVAQEGNNNTTTEGAATTTEGSLQPNQNFSEFPEFDEEFSQSEEDLSSFLSSFMTEVNGTYMNPDIGFQIDLPAGWKGIEINFLINSVFAVPGETNLDLLEEGEDFQEPATFMTIQGIDQDSFNELESLVSELPALEEGGGGVGGEEGTPLQGNGNPLGTTTSPFADNAASCTFSQPSFVTINGINAEERLGECIDEEGGEELVGGVTNLKTK